MYQGRWSAAERDFEREIIPMARDEGMALCPWGALGGGNFTTKEKRENNEQGRNFGPASDKHIKVSEKLEAVAKSKNTAITSIALAYVRSKVCTLWRSWCECADLFGSILMCIRLLAVARSIT